MSAPQVCLLAEDVRSAETVPAPAGEDPALVNAQTGKPCKGKRAAQALARVMNRNDVRDLLADEAPELLALADEALAPFDLARLLGGAS